MTKEDFTPLVFLSFHQKKKIEQNIKGEDIIVLRSHTIDNMKNRGQALLLTIEGTSDIMMITPTTIDKLLLNKIPWYKHQSTVAKYEGQRPIYYLHQILWTPQNDLDLAFLNVIYTKIKELKDRVKDHLYKFRKDVEN